MTVKDLIEILKNANPDAKVGIKVLPVHMGDATVSVLNQKIVKIISRIIFKRIFCEITSDYGSGQCFYVRG